MYCTTFQAHNTNTQLKIKVANNLVPAEEYFSTKIKLWGLHSHYWTQVGTEL